MSNVPNSMGKTAEVIRLLKLELSNYSVETVKAAIAQGAFTEEQIRTILATKGLTEAEIEEIIATNALSASQKGATASTFSLGEAFKGLGFKIKSATASMIAWMATNPVGWLTAVIAAIGAATFGLYKLHDALTVSLEEQKEKLEETKEAYEDVKNELKEVEGEIQSTKDAIEELEGMDSLTWVEQEELDRLREVTKELELQKQLKQEAQLASAEDLYRENKKTFDKEFESSYGNASVDDLRQQLLSGNIAVGQLDLKGNMTDMIAALQHLNEAKKALTDPAEIEMYEASINGITESIKSNCQEYLSSISGYKQSILEIANIRDLTDEEQAFYDHLSSMQKMIYEYYSPATWNTIEFDSVFDTKDIEKTKDELVAMQKAGELSPEILQSYPKLSSAIKESAIIAGEGSDAFREFYNEIVALADKQQDMIGDINDDAVSLSVSDTIDQLNTRLKPAMDSLKSAYNDIFTADGKFELNSIDILSTCDSIKSKLDDMAESGLSIDYSSYEDFVRVLRDSESTTSDVETAFDSLAASITQAALSGTEDFETMKAALEDLGVVNNEIVAFDVLINNTEALKEAGLDLASATYGEIQAFADERVSAENLSQAISMLTQQKMLNALEEMDTSREVSNMISLAKQAGVTSEVIVNLTELEKIYQEVAKGTLSEHMLSQKLARAEELKQMIEAGITKVDYTPKIDFKPVEKAASKASSAVAKKAETDFTDLLDKELNVLDKKMEAGYMDFNDYLHDRLALIDDYYKQGKIKADEYYSYLEKHYDTQLSYRDKVIKAVTRKIDKEIDSLEKQKDEIEDSYQMQIDSLEKQKTLLQEMNKERERQNNLQKALFDLEKARNQRSKLVYTQSKGMIYVPDDAAIRDAKQEADNARYEIQLSEIEKSITKLEQARDRETDAIDDMIDKLQEYKEQWNDITSAYEESQEDLIAAQILGQEWEGDILDCRLDVLNQFKDEYIAIQQAMADAAWQSANEQIKAAQEAAKGAGGSTGSSSKIGNTTKYEVVYEGTAKTIKTFNSQSEAKAYADKMSAGIPDDEPVYYVHKYHTGLQQGVVGKHSFDEDFKLVQKVGLGEKEVPAILKEGEAVATKAQVSNLADGLRQSAQGGQTINSFTIENTIVTSDGHVLRPIQPGDRAWDLMQVGQTLIDKWKASGEEIMSNAFFDGQKQLEKMTREIINNTAINNITNNNRNIQQPVYNTFNL